MPGLLLHAQGSQLAVSLFLLYSPPERNWCSMTYLETASRSLIEAHQLARLRQGLVHMLPTNPFYLQKLAGTEHLSFGFACSARQGIHVNEAEFIPAHCHVLT